VMPADARQQYVSGFNFTDLSGGMRARAFVGQVNGAQISVVWQDADVYKVYGAPASSVMPFVIDGGVTNYLLASFKFSALSERTFMFNESDFSQQPGVWEGTSCMNMNFASDYFAPMAACLTPSGDMIRFDDSALFDDWLRGAAQTPVLKLVKPNLFFANETLFRGYSIVRNCATPSFGGDGTSAIMAASLPSKLPMLVFLLEMDTLGFVWRTSIAAAPTVLACQAPDFIVTDFDGKSISTAVFDFQTTRSFVPSLSLPWPASVGATSRDSIVRVSYEYDPAASARVTQIWTVSPGTGATVAVFYANGTATDIVTSNLSVFGIEQNLF